MSQTQLEGTVARLIERQLELEGDLAEVLERLHVLQTWAQDPQVPFPQVGTRLRDLELKLGIDQKAIIAGVVDAIRGDTQLRELLRGPRGIPGLDGDKGPPGDAGVTVIRERTISG